MNPYNKILLKMNVLEEDKPISCEYESDARYTWPERWAALRAHLAHVASQQPNAADAKPRCDRCDWCFEHFYNFCHNCGKNLRR